jgi:ribosomal protein S6
MKNISKNSQYTNGIRSRDEEVVKLETNDGTQRRTERASSMTERGARERDGRRGGGSSNGSDYPRSETPIERPPVPEGMRLYRIINIVTPTVSSEKAALVVNTILGKTPVLKQNASIEQLAYKVKKHLQGHQIVTDLTCSPEEIMPMRRKMEFNNSIMRTLVINQSRKKHNKFMAREAIGEDLRRVMSQFVSKRGRILFSKSKNQRDKKSISEAIKMLRFSAFLPYCRYDS